MQKKCLSRLEALMGEIKNDKLQKTVIFIDYRCNNKCLFCNQAERRQNVSPLSALEIRQEMTLARQRGATYLELIGGELSIRPDICDLISFAKKLGFSTILMATNGRMYSYFDFTEKIIKAGLTDIIFSIHGHNAKVHDNLTQAPGSFEQLIAGLSNFKKLKFQNIGSNTTINRLNYKYLPQIGQMIIDQGIKNSEFIFIDPNEGGAYENFNKLVPKISQAAPYIRKCLDLGRKNQVWHWVIRYVPLCHFTDYLDQISEIQEAKHSQTEHIAPDFKDFDVVESRKQAARKKTNRCQNCRLFDLCEGIWNEYLKHYGDKELRPVPNS